MHKLITTLATTATIVLAASIVEKQLRVLGVKQPKEGDDKRVSVHVHLQERAAALGLNLEQLRGPIPNLPAPVDAEYVEVNPAVK